MIGFNIPTFPLFFFFSEYIVLIVSMYIVIRRFFSHSSASRIKEKTQILNELFFFILARSLDPCGK